MLFHGAKLVVVVLLGGGSTACEVLAGGAGVVGLGGRVRANFVGRFELEGPARKRVPAAICDAHEGAHSEVNKAY